MNELATKPEIPKKTRWIGAFSACNVFQKNIKVKSINGIIAISKSKTPNLRQKPRELIPFHNYNIYVSGQNYQHT